MCSSSDRDITLKVLVFRSPTAGGQYHWVSEFSPPWCQKYLSYITGTVLSTYRPCKSLYSMLNSVAGWILAIGWQGSVVGLSFLAGTIVRDPSFHIYGRTQISPRRFSRMLPNKVLSLSSVPFGKETDPEHLSDPRPHHSKQQQL